MTRCPEKFDSIADLLWNTYLYLDSFTAVSTFSGQDYVLLEPPIYFRTGDQPRDLVVRVSDYYSRFPALPREFFLNGRFPAVTLVWVGWYNLGLRALLALHPPISPLTSSGKRDCASRASQPQKSVTLLPCPGGRTTKSTRTCGSIG